MSASRIAPGLSLIGLAWGNVIVHFAALLLAAVGMRPGTPLVPLVERMGYLAFSPILWTLGWVAWMFCALTLIVFLAAVTWRLGEQAFLARLGLTVAVVGAAFDFYCNSVYVLVFPALAAEQPPPESLFLVLERTTGIASLVIANGAYSVGILLVTLDLRGRKGLARFTIETGTAVAGFGLLLAAAGFTGAAWHAAWATPPTIILFCLWVILVARSLQPAGRIS